MGQAACAICGAIVTVRGVQGNRKVEPDPTTFPKLCQQWPPPPEARRGLQGESPTGCPHLDKAAMTQMGRW
jgi:hypothetical protein